MPTKAMLDKENAVLKRRIARLEKMIAAELSVNSKQPGAKTMPRKQADEERRSYRKHLEDLVRERTRKLKNEITECKRAEHALLENNAYYRTIVEAANEGIVMAYPYGVYYFVNQQMADMLGYPVEEILGKSSIDFTFENWKPQVYQARQVLQKNASVHGEFKFRRKDGSVLWTLYNATPVFDQRGKHIANFALHTDITERKHAEQQLQVLSRQLIEAQEQERRAIGRELHDEIGQVLTGLKILLETAAYVPVEIMPAKLEQAIDITRELLERVRDLSLNLRPPILDDMGLFPALLWLIQNFMKQTSIDVDFVHHGLQGRRFASAVETAVYRLAQEALTNIARHAQVKQAHLNITCNETRIEFVVKDDGKGFDMEEKLVPGQTVGLNSMRERVRLLGGNFSLKTRQGRGTTLRIQIPLEGSGEGM